VLERVSAPLCEAVLCDTPGLVRSGGSGRVEPLLVPLDRRGEWYRYHHLFRDMLLAELERPAARPDSGAPAARCRLVPAQRPA
jgi:LuxR family maltose regulon positive regulatory protein